MLSASPSQTTLGRGLLKTFLLSGIVFCAHAALTIALYRERMLGGGAIFESDAVIFLLPFLIALLVYAGILWRLEVLRSGRRRRLTVASIAFGLSVVSFLVGLTVSLNLYGS